MAQLNCQQKVQGCFEKGFGKWADMVSRRTTIVFIVSFVVFVALGKCSKAAANQFTQSANI